MKQIIECVPNFSEGRDKTKIEKIVDAFRGKTGVKLLDYNADEDHNRMVVTIIGEPSAVKDAMIEAAGTAAELINLNGHTGQHPRMGATDVVPFIPIKNITIAEAVEISEDVASALHQQFGIPTFLYEKSATAAHRENLSNVRKGEFEGLAEKMKQPEWQPDFGEAKPHPTAGATAVGARMPLIAYNVNLNTTRLEIADKIAKNVRHIGGGLRFCKAMGVELKDKGMVQVSMNLTDFTKTAVYRAFELVRIEAARYGVTIAGSEIIGLVPLAAIIDTAGYYLGLEDFSASQILETHLME